MTTMDYEALRMGNVNLIDKVDERERDLEKYWTTYVIGFVNDTRFLNLTRTFVIRYQRCYFNDIKKCQVRNCLI